MIKLFRRDAHKTASVFVCFHFIAISVNFSTGLKILST